MSPMAEFALQYLIAALAFAAFCAVLYPMFAALGWLS